MSLTLHSHPLSSFCHKVLIALYENGTPFEPHLVDLGNAESAAAFKKIWPIGKFPVLRDDARDRTVAESSIIIEYLEQHYPGRTRFLPAEPDLARAGPVGRSLLRPARPPADAEDRRRPAAPGRTRRIPSASTTPGRG